MITTGEIKSLRDKTGISIMQCKRALEKADGDPAKALDFLKEESALIAEKKSDRTLKSGIIGAYIHAGGSIGALIKLSCETDFVAKNPDFNHLAEELAMHVAAMEPESLELLLTQPFIRDPKFTVSDLVKSSVQKFGENIMIENFTRQAI